ncbi:MAG: dethiobiotin synthase [Cyanobacteria bacterium P01_G01_bin.4]
MSKAVFISGTDTDVGKTVVSALLCHCLLQRGLTVGYYKPVQSGAFASDDASNKWISPDCELVARIAPQAIVQCSYVFPLPAAPQLAAEQMTPPVEIDPQVLDLDFHILRERCDVTVVEGAGGLAVPLTPQLSISDLVQRWHLPLVLVSRPHLGTINHTTLSIAYCQQLRITRLGTVIAYNDPHLNTNDPVLASAPSYIRQLADNSPIHLLPYIQLQSPQSSPTWQRARSSLSPLIDKLLKYNATRVYP